MARTRGAGTARLHAGGNVYNSRCQGGGDKKAGLVPTATGFMLSMPFAWNATLGINGRGNASTKNYILSTVNQIGGVGSYRSATSMPSDGVNSKLLAKQHNDCKKSLGKFY